MADVARHATEVPRRRGPKIALIVLAVIAAVLVTAVGSIAFMGKRLADTYNAGVTHLDDSEVFPDDSKRAPEGQDGSETILLLGSDTRTSIDPDDIDADQDARSDSIMVLQIPASRDHIYATSIMRDAWVDIDGLGPAKINAALAYGGVPLAVQTVEELIGTKIDHVALVDFDGFKAATDALGGVSLNNPNDFNTSVKVNSIHFPKGKIDLNGEEALAFVRERKAFPDGDYQRTRNQQLYFKAMLQKMMSRSVLTNPSQILDVVGSISPYIASDSGLDVGYLTKVLTSLGGISTKDIVTFTAPTQGVGTSADGQSIINLDPERMSLLKQAFQNDTLADYVATQDLKAY